MLLAEKLCQRLGVTAIGVASNSPHKTGWLVDGDAIECIIYGTRGDTIRLLPSTSTIIGMPDEGVVVAAIRHIADSPDII